MSKSVTIIRGTVWTPRSVTCSRNNNPPEPNDGFAPESNDDKDEDERDRKHGWHCHRGRGFRRRTRHLNR